jgi:hypothetical protein
VEGIERDVEVAAIQGSVTNINSIKNPRLTCRPHGTKLIRLAGILPRRRSVAEIMTDPGELVKERCPRILGREKTVEFRFSNQTSTSPSILLSIQKIQGALPPSSRLGKPSLGLQHVPMASVGVAEQPVPSKLPWRLIGTEVDRQRFGQLHFPVDPMRPPDEVAILDLILEGNGDHRHNGTGNRVRRRGCNPAVELIVVVNDRNDTAWLPLSHRSDEVVTDAIGSRVLRRVLLLQRVRRRQLAANRRLGRYPRGLLRPGSKVFLARKRLW